MISIPLIGGDCWVDLKRISNSDEMRPWSVGDRYDRPIPRRLLEEAGVSREMFGWKKFGAGISYSLDTFGRLKQKMSAKSYEELLAYKNKFPCWGLKDLLYSVEFYWINKSLYFNYICSRLHLNFRMNLHHKKEGMIANPYSTMMLCWGIEKMKERYKI